MHFSVTFRHMHTSEALKEYAREKVERIRKYFPDPIMAHVVMSTERGYQHCADVNIQLHNGLLIKGTEVTEDMYSSVDLVMAKIERQVRRYKEKIRHHKSRDHLGTIPVMVHVLEELTAEEEKTWPPSDGVAATTAAPPPAPSGEGTTAPRMQARVLRTEHLPARPFTIDEAIMQLNLAGQPFFVFRNSGNGHVNVVYRRDDGAYGLIETGAVVHPATQVTPAPVTDAAAAATLTSPRGAS